MADELYVVGIDLRQIGQDPTILKPGTEARLRATQSRLGHLKSGFRDLAEGAKRFDNVLSSAVRTVGHVGMWGGLIAGGAVIGGITYGVTKLNAELEQTTISLGAIFSAQGLAPNLNVGLDMASQTIVKMRKDAALLPGEFKDLLGIFRTGAIGAFGAGLNVDQWRELSAKAMATAAVASLPMDQAAREFSLLIERGKGRAGAHNVFGMRLLGLSGEKAAEFNKKSAQERMAIVSAELDKYSDSIQVFGKSWEGVSSTFIDSIKEFARRGTEPLFNSVKESLINASGWFDRNQESIEQYVDIWGLRLAHAWDVGRRKLEEWGPVILTFVDNASSRLQQIWQDISPGVERFGELVQEALKDPGTIDKLITLAKLWAGLKAVQFVGGSMGGFKMASGAWKLSKAIGMGGGLGWAGTAAGGGGAAAAGGAAGGGTLAGLAVGAAGAASALAALAGVGLAAWQGYELYKDVQDQRTEDEKAIAENVKAEIEESKRLGESSHELVNRFNRLQGEAEKLKESTRHWTDAQLAMKGMDRAAMDLQIALYGAASAAASFEAAAAGRMAAIARENQISPEGPQAARTNADLALLGATQMAKDALRDPNSSLNFQAKAAEAARHKGGGGGTKIQKVEIVVTSNQNPSRIAREVRDELAQVSRTRKASRYTFNPTGYRP